MATAEGILDRVRALNVWKQHGARAPHKPLLLLLALGRIEAGEPRLVRFADVGQRLCHGHHIEWLSRGGADELDNMVLVYPNHHAAIHRDDAPFDFETLAFRFSIGRREELRVDRHLAGG